MPATPSLELQELARSYGVQLEYRDMSGQMKAASTESLLAILRVLGANLGTEEDAPEAIRQRRLAQWKRGVEPVVVLWEEEGDGSVEVRIPEALAADEFTCRLQFESNEPYSWKVIADRFTPISIEGERFLTFNLPMPPLLPAGYYKFSLVNPGRTYQTTALLIRAPKKAYEPPPAVAGKRPWGVFCPLYALHSDRSWGAGDFSDLEALIEWTAGQGGNLVATLPMLASNFDGPSPIISPYSPTSRLFWNEFYLALDRIPELANCPEARALMDSEGIVEEIETLRESGLVDYGCQMKQKRAVLEVLADSFLGQGIDNSDPEKSEFLAFLADNPDATTYARFQATGELHGRDWRNWPASYREESGVDALGGSFRYHLYVQWKADQQLRSLALKTRHHGLTWYLDFPVGVDHNSYDVWKNREIFATGASVGCPPDPVFTNGQNWGFPPAHPDLQRESGYAYLIASIRNHLRYANALRIDHVMGLHRLFWIHRGSEAKDGAFVSTPAEEIYAILSLESHRHKAWLVGEDLGTVPPEVDQAMKAHNVRGMYVIQYEIRADENQPLREVPASTIASVNTHDMPTFASFWSGIDLDDRKELGLLDQTRLEAEKRVRDDQRRALTRFLIREKRLDPRVEDAGSILQAIHEWLAASPTSVLLLNIEDLWLETEPQNTPNTYTERPNWRRKLRRRFEDFSSDAKLEESLDKIDRLRSELAN